MATTTIIPLHAGKIRTVTTILCIRVDYMENPNKTEQSEWVTSYERDPLIADDEFMFSKNEYAAITGATKERVTYRLSSSYQLQTWRNRCADGK